LIVFRI